MSEFISTELLLFVTLGFLAPLIDGALGMAYGLIATSAALLGAPPAIASASIHAAEIVTTGLAGGSHVWNKNVDWKLFKRLAPAGVAGGVLGAYILVGLPETIVKVFVTLYLMGMAFLILRRILAAASEKRSREAARKQAADDSHRHWRRISRRHRRRRLGTAGHFHVDRARRPPASQHRLCVAVGILRDAVDIRRVPDDAQRLEYAAACRADHRRRDGSAARRDAEQVLPPRMLMIMVAVVIGVLCVYNMVRLGMAAAKALGGSS